MKKDEMFFKKLLLFVFIVLLVTPSVSLAKNTKTTKKDEYVNVIEAVVDMDRFIASKIKTFESIDLELKEDENLKDEEKQEIIDLMNRYKDIGIKNIKITDRFLEDLPSLRYSFIDGKIYKKNNPKAYVKTFALIILVFFIILMIVYLFLSIKNNKLIKIFKSKRKVCFLTLPIFALLLALYLNNNHVMVEIRSVEELDINTLHLQEMRKELTYEEFLKDIKGKDKKIKERIKKEHS